MPAAGLSDDQVVSELTKMVEFIKREAAEKVKEIKIKANEEYEIEKSEIVRSEIAAIDKSYEQKLKQAKMSQQIVKSTSANKYRLQVLGAKAEILDGVFQDAEKKLQQISSDESQYSELLTKLIGEGIPLLKNEKHLLITVRERDVELAKKAASKAASDAKSDVTIDVNTSTFVDEESAGGVLVSTANRKIVINNTLEERLQLLGEKALPAIRLELFGPSKTRKFFD